mmetsp:Transcript_1599/g.4839  ORF Transcript_1599/g.4839 Transcript_1599/m.4839 type:complete len:238 (+) Transcript_1599:594-1307(+)
MTSNANRESCAHVCHLLDVDWHVHDKSSCSSSAPLVASPNMNRTDRLFIWPRQLLLLTFHVLSHVSSRTPNRMKQLRPPPEQPMLPILLRHPQHRDIQVLLCTTREEGGWQDVCAVSLATRRDLFEITRKPSRSTIRMRVPPLIVIRKDQRAIQSKGFAQGDYHRMQHAAHSPPLPPISETVEQELATLTSPLPTTWKLQILDPSLYLVAVSSWNVSTQQGGGGSEGEGSMIAKSHQ